MGRTDGRSFEFKMKVTAIAYILMLLFSCKSNPGGHSSRGLSRGHPQDVKMNRDLLVRALRIIKSAVDAGQVTGIQVLVARGGRIVLYEAFGYRDLDKKLPMEKTTLIRMASNTKTLTATAVLILADEGLVDIDSPVSAYLPAFSNGLSSRLRVVDLLRYTTGFTNQFDNFSGDLTFDAGRYPGAPSLHAEATKIAEVGPQEEPGKHYLYSNWGYTILGAIIERVSGRDIESFLQERIYRPLGMLESSNKLFGVDAARVSMNYLRVGDKWEVLPPESLPFVRSTGGMVTTAEDFAKFCQMYLNKGRYGHVRILSERTAQEATSLQAQGPSIYLTPANLARLGLCTDWYTYRDSRKLNIDIGYGYGWVISADGSYNHAGFRGTFALVDPKKDLIILLFGQSRCGGTPGQEFIDAVYASII